MCYNDSVNRALSLRAPRTMCARLAVLLTEHATKHAHPERASRAEGSLPTAPFPRPPHPTLLLFRPHLVRLSPLPATLIDHPASVANKRLTTGLTLLDATLTKNQGRGYSRKPMSPKSLRHNPFADPHPLTHVGSILYKNSGGEGEASHSFITSLLPYLVASSRRVVSFHPVNILLSEIECRVLGSLIEKEITTPEYYPLSLNALLNACNQKSNRDPVMNLDEAAVRQALHSLDGQSLVRSVSASDSRVTKYEHRLQEAFNFYRHEIAILCVLLLRGPQTPGELRTRAERMHTFDDLSAVQSSLQRLMKREPPLAKVLPRQPGTKESRYAHLLSGDVEVFESKLEIPAIMNASSADGERIALLEKEVVALRNNAADFQKEITDLRQQFAQLKKQFE